MLEKELTASRRPTFCTASVVRVFAQHPTAYRVKLGKGILPRKVARYLGDRNPKIKPKFHLLRHVTTRYRPCI